MVSIIGYCPGSFGNSCNSRLADSAVCAANRAGRGGVFRSKKLVAVFELGWSDFGSLHCVLAVAKFEALVEQSAFNRPAFFSFSLCLVCAAESF